MARLQSILLMAFVMLFQRAYPQVLLQDTAFLAAAIHNSIQLYSKDMHRQANLYNGSEYLEPERTNDQHPYFQSDDWLNGSVLYDGDWYPNVPLQYDITQDIVITELHTNGNPLVLVDAKVGGFSIDGHTFRKFVKDTLNALPETGYYEVLYDGATRVIVRRQKSIQEKVDDLKIAIDFEERNRYFLFYNGRYFSVRSKRSVLAVLQGRQSDLKKFVRAKGVRFKKDREASLRRLAEFYDTLE